MRILAVLSLLFFTMPAWSLDSSQGRLAVDRFAGNRFDPWGLGFLPSGDVLITERGGKLLGFDRGGKRRTIAGTPDVVAKGQGGLLDIMIPHDFSQTREVYLSFVKRQRGGEGTALGRGKLSPDGTRLIGFETLFEIAPGSGGGRHFGSRLVEAHDGTIFMTIGDRGDGPSAQDLSRHNGSVLRLTRDGDPAPGNPFLTRSGAQDEIWSFGHRNPQGAALDMNGELLVVEHGAKGGDEVNRIRKGANFGWPVISYGRHYSGRRIGEGTAKAGLEQPAHYWDPSIAPSGMVVYSGKMWPEWKGDIFIGSLKFNYISRLSGRDRMSEVEQLKSRDTRRVRDVREAPDGSIWFLSVNTGAAYRISK